MNNKITGWGGGFVEIGLGGGTVFFSGFGGGFDAIGIGGGPLNGEGGGWIFGELLGFSGGLLVILTDGLGGTTATFFMGAGGGALMFWSGTLIE